MTRPKERLAIYAHYDPRARVRAYVTHTLARLREDCGRIVFVSTAGLPESEQDKVRPYCERVLSRENVGFDFSMWQDALRATDTKSADELILVNSSVLGPVHPLAPIFERMTATGCDFWGMTECETFAPHLQSYFLVIRERLLHSEAFADFFRSVLPYRDKLQVIRSYEIGLTRFFVEQGFRYEALITHEGLGRTLRKGRLPTEPLGARRRLTRTFNAWRWYWERLNPTYLYPIELLSLGMPFLKIEHLRDNPQSLPLERMYAALAELGYPRSLLGD